MQQQSIESIERSINQRQSASPNFSFHYFHARNRHPHNLQFKFNKHEKETKNNTRQPAILTMQYF